MDRLDELVVSPVPWGGVMGAGARQDAEVVVRSEVVVVRSVVVVVRSVVVVVRSVVAVRGGGLMGPEPG
jgi:hypothetical protein